MSQHDEEDPSWVQMEDDPIEDYEVENLNLDGLMKRIDESGWTSTSTATEPDLLTKTYSAERTFEELMEDMAEDFGICVVLNETNRTVAFSDCP